MTISRGAATCPACETDWSRIRRSRRKSSEERQAERSRATLIGGAIALLAAGVVYGIWRLVESGQAAAGADAMGSAVGSLGTSVVRALAVVWVPLVVFVLGAAGGLVTHYVRQKRRRRRRRRVSKRDASPEV
ncbi:MAG: hypothetical protein FJW79_09790 [Actinobacteria bacterium]|nr:hypothetical protein [Actinomycetota bacterium]